MHVRSRQQMPAHASRFCADEYMWNATTAFYISVLSFRTTEKQKFNIFEKKTNFTGNMKTHLEIMACISQCKYSNASKLHNKFEGSKEIHKQNHCVFLAFFYPLSLRSLSFHRGSWSPIWRKFCVMQQAFVLLVPDLSGRVTMKIRRYLQKIQSFTILLCFRTIFCKT